MRPSQFRDKAIDVRRCYPRLEIVMSIRILVMDDDESICRIFGLMLGKLGYEVEAVNTGEAAIDSYRKARVSGKPFRVVILDLTVRDGMGGEEALVGLKSLDPDVCAVCASGQSRDATSDTYLQQGFKAVLPKPFRFQDVADCIQSLLGPPTST